MNMPTVADLEKSFMSLKKSKDHMVTFVHKFGKDMVDNRWAIVLAWQDGYEEPEWRIVGKVACQPSNSLMQEYDFDWTMPCDERGNVDDSEVTIESVTDLKWLIKTAERMKTEYCVA